MSKDQLLVRKEQGQVRASPVPAWFRHAFAINPEPGEANIQAGWKQLGSIKLQSDPSFAYDSIWSSAMTLVVVFGWRCHPAVGHAVYPLGDQALEQGGGPGRGLV
ncbi:MAG: hypothetical protein IPJ18_16135 [Betaproteobacteria bacterium]|nr:hypothetical protein [Betaproteobacteria bacterium]